MRVLHVALKLDPGGTERLILDLVRRADDDIESEVCCLDALGLWGEHLRDDGTPIHLVQREPGFHPSLSLRLAKLARDRAIDVIHCHQYSPFVYGTLATLVQRSLDLVFTEHGRIDAAPPSAKRRWANRLLGRVPGDFFAVCEDLRQHMLAEGFRANRLGVIYNGVDLGSVPDAETRARARTALGIASDRPIVGTVARLDPVKDLPTLIRAAEKLDVELVIVGDGPERGTIEAMGNDRVHLLGYRKDVRDLLPAFDIFANSSRQEGVSLTIVEAMACALPVVATGIGGTPEVVADNVSGTLVPPADPAALGDAIAHLLGNEDTRVAYGAAGRSRAVERFSLDEMVKKYVAIYRAAESS